MMKLELDRPIVFFDLETTGVSVQRDRIVEICVAKVMPDGTQDVRTRRINPEMPIPAEATAIHGIVDDDVAGQPTFCQIARSFYAFIDGCDLGGFNVIRFDVPMLVEEFKRAGIAFSTTDRRIVDASVVFRRKEPRTLTAAVKFYCGEEHLDAHGAEADVLATMKVIEGQLARYDDLPANIGELAAFCHSREPDWVDGQGKIRWRGGDAVIGFGKQSGTPLRELAAGDPGYLNWILRSDFPDDVKQIVAAALDGRFPTPPVAS